MKIFCPKCKSRSIISKGEISNALHFECNDCGRSFDRIMPEKVTTPIKEPHVYTPPPVPTYDASRIQVGRSWDDPISSLPISSGPLSFEYMASLMSQAPTSVSSGWGVPRITDNGSQVEFIPQDMLIDTAGQLKFRINSNDR